MKKRVFSFAIMVLTLIALIAFGVPNIKNNSKIGMEFNGGFDILYEVDSEDNALSSSQLANMAAEGIEKRLDISNIIDPIVEVEGNKYVRVSVSASSQLVADEIRSIIENSAQITFRDYQNNLKATGEEILEDVGASLSDQTDANGYPVILLHIKDTELLGSITEEISALEDQHLVVWLGYEEGDDYANLSTDASVAKKIIYNATVSSKLDTDTITVTGSFSKSTAQSTVDLINSGTLDYNLDVVQISTIQTDYASSSFNKMLIAGLIVMVLIVVVLSAYYKLSGLVSSITLMFNTFLSITLFVAFKGILNQQAIAALIVSLGIAVDAIIIVLERVKNELYNGKNMERALNEGYKKSIFSVVDANVVVLIVSLMMFFLGTSIINFAIMLALSSVCTLVIMTVVNKLLLTLLVKLNVKPTAFGANKNYLESKENYLNSKQNNANHLKNTKKLMLGTGIFATVSIIVMLVLQLTMGSLFNYNNTIKENSSITIVSNTEYFTDNAHVMEFFDKEGVELELKDIEITSFEKDNVTKYKVTVTTDESVTAVEDELVNEIINVFGENTEFDERYELYINDINPKSATVSLLSALYTTGIALVLVGIYLAIRYRYSYAIAAVVSAVLSIVLTALAIGLTRIKIGSDAIIAIFAISVYSLNTLIVIFNRLKEMLVTTNKKYISNTERYEALKKAINVSYSRIILSTLAVTLVSVVLLSFSSLTNYSFYLALVIGLIFSSFCAIVFASSIWMLFEKRSDKKKRTFKPKKKSSRFKELEEHVFIGIND